MIETRDQEQLKAWFCDRLKFAPTKNLVVIANVDFNGRILGAVGYENYNGASVECHIAADDPRWLTKQMCWVMFDYPFNQLGCKVIMAPVASTNHNCLSIIRRLGATEVCVIPDAHPTGDLHIFSMRRDECKWLKWSNHGKRF